MSAPVLRDYQVRVVDHVDLCIEQGLRKILLVAPTGSGKTVIAGEIIRRHRAKLKSALFVAHRREIVAQTSEKLSDIDVPHGIIMAGTIPRGLEFVQVAAIQTLHARAIRADTMALPPADLLIVDEAHHACATTYKKLIEAYPNATILGLTATPCRGDGRGLGGIFETMVHCPQVQPLIDLGHLVKPKYFAPIDAQPDLRGVHITAGDYNKAALARRMNQDPLVGDIITNYHKFGERRPTVVFTVDVAHSVHITREFLAAGVRAEHIDGSTPKEERDATLKRLKSGDIDVVCNCMVLTEGWDCPEASCCILARPTKSMGLFRQMIGRILRPAPGKTDAIVIDHSGAVRRHGFVEDAVEWTLDPDLKAETPEHKANKNGSTDRLKDCPKCEAIMTAGKPCFNCGYFPVPRAEAIVFEDGDLGEVGRDGSVSAPKHDPNEWHAMLAHIANENEYKPGWVAHKFKEKFGRFPAWGLVPEPIEPTPEVLSWVRSRRIAYAKGRAKAKAVADAA
jgi:superfamily II DNA or RNA helicase